MTSKPAPGDLGPCRACPQEMRWALMQSGSMNPLDLDEIPLEQVLRDHRGIIAYNPQNGHGLSITKERLGKVEDFALNGITFHLTHFATCPERKRFKRKRSAG